MASFNGGRLTGLGSDDFNQYFLEEAVTGQELSLENLVRQFIFF